ncbi:MAG: hypothetical protein PHT94_03520 [Candidatus Nanoarchaeia archaeon]|nr:hypothetical protein [Candidatus Nanoarchaeia archaeon]
MNIDPNLCIRCKGKLLCGLKFCPLYAQNEIEHEIKEKLDFENKDNIDTITNGVFIGSNNYPSLSVGFLGSLNRNPEKYEDLHKFSIKKVVKERLLNIRNFRNYNISKINLNSYYFSNLQDISMAENKMDNEVKSDKLEKKSSFSFIEAPYGPKAHVEKLRLNDNPKISKIMYKLTEDTDLLSKDAVNYLYKNNFSKNYIENVFSTATLGIGKNRKLVPTRWSITATDDLISKEIIKNIKLNKQDNNYFGFYYEQYGNHFFIFMLPLGYKFEMFEVVQKNTLYNSSNQDLWTYDYEDFEGRKKYAENVTGGYYAARLPITKFQSDNKIQMSTIVIRVIDKNYTTPLGVWVIREGIRKSLLNKFEFESEEKLLKFMTFLIKHKTDVNVFDYLNKSNILKLKLRQSLLNEWLK